MKKVIKLLIALMVCVAMVGCSKRTSEPKPDPLPHIPQRLYAINEITPASMEELESKVAALTIRDFLHADRIAMFEKRGFEITISNIKILDCNSIYFNIVLTKTDGNSLTLPATGMLMYQYLPMDKEYIGGLEVVWGNLALYENQIVLVNIDTMSLWSSDTLKQVFRQPDLTSFIDGEFFFILDAVKSKNGYLLPYFSSESSGFITVSLSGEVVNIPLQITDKNNGVFGAYKLMESRNFNTRSRVDTLLHCFYGDEDEKQLFICHTQFDEYSGERYWMYDFEKGVFIRSYQMVSYQTPPYDFDIYGMCFYENGKRVTKDTTIIAEKKQNGVIVDKVVFKADIDSFEFGSDLKTGWNTYTHITLSEDMNVIDYGCSKTNTVMTIDFADDTAKIIQTDTMPKMLGVDNSPNSMHLVYRAHNKQDTALVVRILSGNCRMDYLADVSGRWGIDWLAGFNTHKYIYVLSTDRFILFRWDGSNYWTHTVHLGGNFEVNMDTVNELCNVYAY